MPVDRLPAERSTGGSGSLDAFIGVASRRRPNQQQQQQRESGSINNTGNGAEAGAGGGTQPPQGERYFSVRWMLERERAREASDDCSSAFAIIPVGEYLVLWEDTSVHRLLG